MSQMLGAIGITLLFSVVAIVLILHRLTLGMLDRCPECEQGWLRFRETVKRRGVAYNVYACTRRQCSYVHEEKLSSDEVPAI